MFEDINEYILKPLEVRQKHIALDTECVELNIRESRECRALLAWQLKTTIPSGLKIVLCHACHNGKCCNPKHLYWGTSSENLADSFNNGRKTIWQYTVEKYGEDKARKIAVKNGGSGKSPTPRYLPKEVISERMQDLESIERSRGYISKLAKKWQISHSSVRRFINNYGAACSSKVERTPDKGKT